MARSRLVVVRDRDVSSRLPSTTIGARIQPFDDRVNYNLPIRLIAIAPSFHKDNLTDIKYHALDFECWKFNLVDGDDAIHFILKDELTENSEPKIFSIPYPRSTKNIDVSEPSKPFLNILSKCDPVDREGLLQVRRQILSYDDRLRENSKTNQIEYGKGGLLCAEIRFDPKRNHPALFLWLPLARHHSRHKQFCARMRIWTDWQIVTAL